LDSLPEETIRNSCGDGVVLSTTSTTDEIEMQCKDEKFIVSKQLLTKLYLCIHNTVDGRLNVNVALNRPSYLSSVYTDPTYGPLGPSKGNDGDKTNCDGGSASNSVAHSQIELNPWYTIDLGVALHVAGVNLTNRGDAGGKRGLELSLLSL